MSLTPRIPKPKTDEIFADLTPLDDRKRWTRTECDDLERYGFLPERYELIDGEIISKMRQKIPHSGAVMRVILYLVSLFGGDRLLTQTTVEVTRKDQKYNRPEPDIVVLKQTIENYDDRPDVGEAVFIAEVAESSLGTDLKKKATLYARAGFPEYWVIDTISRRVIVHRTLSGGKYKEVTVHDETEEIALTTFPDRPTPISALLVPKKIAKK